MRRSVGVMGVALLVLLVATLLIWYAAIREDHRGRLTVSFLNVGQGDAVFIQAPSGRQVLVDGGPDASVLRRLGDAMPFYDRSLDIVITTSADAGAVTGLVDVIQRYKVDSIIQTGVENSTPIWYLFEKEAADSGAKILTGQRGQIVDLGSGAYLEILSPDRSVPEIASDDGCLMMRLVYGQTSFMLPCDSTIGVQQYLSMLDGTSLRSDVLALNGTKPPSQLFVGYVAPQYAVGCGVSNATTSTMLTQFGVQSFDTCKTSVTFVTNGQTISEKN